VVNAATITVHEPMGNILGPVDLLERVAKGDSEDLEVDRLYEEATRYTIERFEVSGSPVGTDGEQGRYHNFATHCVHGLPNEAGMVLKSVLRWSHRSPLAAHTRLFPLHEVRRLLPRCRDALRG
jgi:hypothetical protein